MSEQGTARAAGGSVWLSFGGSVWMSFGGSGCVSLRGGGRKPPATARSMHADDRKRRFGERKSLGKGRDGCSAGNEMVWNGGLTLTLDSRKKRSVELALPVITEPQITALRVREL